MKRVHLKAQAAGVGKDPGEPQAVADHSHDEPPELDRPEALRPCGSGVRPALRCFSVVATA